MAAQSSQLQNIDGSGFQPFNISFLIPSAARWAGMDLAFGASMTLFYNSLSAKGAPIYQPRAKPWE
jgi:hypothetical protein